LFPTTTLRESELLPGLRLRAGTSIVEIVRIVPTQKEVVFKNNRGGLFRMQADRFVTLAKQQGYRKIWDLATFLRTLKGLLKPVLTPVPLMWVLHWIVQFLRKPSLQYATRIPEPTEKLE
jgi:hypothetical protein